MKTRISVIGLLLIIAHAQCIMWYMEPNTQKCLREELQAHVVFTGEYEVSEVPGQKVDFVVCIDFTLICW